MSVDDLIDFTPELRAEAVQVVSRYRMGPLFTPPVVSKQEGPIGTLGWGSTASWPGGSFDPETGVFYIFSTRSIGALSIVPRPANIAADMVYVQGSALSGARTTAGAGSAQGGGDKVFAMAAAGIGPFDPSAWSDRSAADAVRARVSCAYVSSSESKTCGVGLMSAPRAACSGARPARSPSQ